MDSPNNVPMSIVGDEVAKSHEQKIEKSRRLFTEVAEDPLQGLVLIDALQRLGIDYHFYKEIKPVLEKQYRLFTTENTRHDDLYEVALRFRLLRQEGYYVTPDVFNHFDMNYGKLEAKPTDNIKGLMELFEASQMKIEGETILDRAGEFSAQLLRSWAEQHEHDQNGIVSNTLSNPRHKTLGAFTSMFFLEHHGHGQCPNHRLKMYLEKFRGLAKADFNLVRSLYRKEAFQVLKWWQQQGLTEELKLARHQPLKWYIWSAAVLDDASLSSQRVELTKPISLVYIIDDIFDVYGSVEELTLFADAINRWEIDDAAQLPKYMRTCLNALFNISDELSHHIFRKHGWDPSESLKKTWKRLCDAFLVEAKWLASGNLPKTEEYLKNAIVTSGVPLVLIHLFFLLGESITQTAGDVMDDDAGIIFSTAALLRLWDDLGTSKDENQDGRDGSYIDCYRRENPGASVDEARGKILNLISNTWERLNTECFSASNPFPPSFTRACLNSGKMIPLMYNYDEHHKLPSLEKYVQTLLSENVPT